MCNHRSVLRVEYADVVGQVPGSSANPGTSCVCSMLPGDLQCLWFQVPGTSCALLMVPTPGDLSVGSAFCDFEIKAFKGSGIKPAE